MKPDLSALYVSTSGWLTRCIIQGVSHVMLLVRYLQEVKQGESY